MSHETKNSVFIAIISALSAIIVAWITTNGTIATKDSLTIKQLEESINPVKSKIEILSGSADSLSTIVNEIIESQKVVNFPVGTIVSSILPPDKFAKAVGDVDLPEPSWILADGRSINGASTYSQLTGDVKIPDLRGMFLRGMNEGRADGNEDPDRNRIVGQLQMDSFKKHDHNLVFHYRSFRGEGDKVNLQLMR